jgi:hypothetical protein
MNPQDYYTSELVDPFINDGLTQEDLQEQGYIRYKQDSIKNTIGTDECMVNINLFLDEVLGELSDEGVNQYALECLRQLVFVYNLTHIDTVVNDMSSYSDDYIGDIFTLLKLLEGSDKFDILSKLLPHMSLDVMRTENYLYKLLYIHYSEFVTKLEEDNDIDSKLFKLQFMNCSKIDGINILIKLIQVDPMMINMRQITTGE